MINVCITSLPDGHARSAPRREASRRNLIIEGLDILHHQAVHGFEARPAVTLVLTPEFHEIAAQNTNRDCQ
jgi:cytochrome c5